MKMYPILVTTMMLLLCIPFSIAQNAELKEWALKGTTSTADYYSEIPFRYIDGYIFIDLIQNAKSYNFLFDTGAESTVIDAAIIDEFEFEIQSSTSINGPVITNQNVKRLVVSKIQIDDVTFQNTGAVAVNLKFASRKFRQPLHGIIGSNLLKKSKWQIDYKHQIIRFSNQISNFDLGNGVHKINTRLPEKGWGTETVEMTIDGHTSPFNFDTGNGRSKIVSNSKDLKKIAKKNKKSSLSYGLHKETTDVKFIADSVSIGDLVLSDQIISLENEVGNRQLLGNRFYENFLLTIDWQNHQLYLSPQKAIPSDELVGFELEFAPDFETDRIEVATGLKSFTKKNNIRKGMYVSEINGTAISQLSKEEFRTFWSNRWPELMKEQELIVALQNEGKIETISLLKKKLK